ncbi:MAG: hypothetical protein ABFD89_03750 [Bryobacteraceae bacterium]
MSYQHKADFRLVSKRVPFHEEELGSIGWMLEGIKPGCPNSVRDLLKQRVLS